VAERIGTSETGHFDQTLAEYILETAGRQHQTRRARRIRVGLLLAGCLAAAQWSNVRSDAADASAARYEQSTMRLAGFAQPLIAPDLERFSFANALIADRLPL
jgi:hypothetical protein